MLQEKDPWCGGKMRPDEKQSYFPKVDYFPYNSTPWSVVFLLHHSDETY